MQQKRIYKEKITLNPFYWDCECLYEFIHTIDQKTCDECGAEIGAQPESREDEIERLISNLDYWVCKCRDAKIRPLFVKYCDKCGSAQ